MDKTKKKTVRRYVLWGVLALVTLWLAVMPLMARQQQEEDGPVASILSTNASVSSIRTAVHGGGTLDAGEPEKVEIPRDVKITEFLVKNGEMVSEGDALASVDKVSVMTAITQVRNSMTAVEKQMENARNEKAETTVSATAGGRVKEVYARQGDRVESVLLEHGALAVLSLDGRMCVTLTAGSDLSTGDSVPVTLADGKEIAGRVESNLNGELVVTVEDKGYAVGQTVTVAGVGAGKLEIHSPWSATAFTGTIATVSAKPEQTLSSGATLFTLKDTDYTAQRELLAKTHRDYEELLQKLFQMYETGVISAPCDGMISGIDRDSTHLLAAEEEVLTVQLLSNRDTEYRLVLLGDEEGSECTNNPGCPLEDGDPEHQQSCPRACNRGDNCRATSVHFSDCPHNCTMKTGCEAKFHKDGCPEICTGNNSCQVTDPTKHLDYCPRRCTNAKGCQAIHHKDGCPEKCTNDENCQAGIDNHLPSCPKYCSCSDTCIATEHRDGCPKIVTKEYKGVVGIVTRVEPTGNVIYLAVDSAAVGTITYTNKWDFGTLNVKNPTGAVPSDTPYTVGDAGVYTQGDVVVIAYADDGTYQIVKTGNKAAVSGGGMGNLDLSGLMGGMPSFSFNFSMPGMGGGTSGSQTQLYDLNGDVLMTVTPQDTMKLTVAVDEGDISGIKQGMTAEITINALPGEEFEGEITRIAVSGGGNGGSSKFDVEITLPRQSKMLAGMSASAVIPLYEKMNVLTLPVAALVEDGGKTVVYTALDKKTGEPSAPVEVTIGISDGENVEILSGLKSGDSVYYYYYDTLEESDAVETDRFKMA